MKNSSKLNQSPHPSVAQENSIDNNEMQVQALNASMASFLKLDMLSHNFEAGVNDFLNKVEDIIKDTEEDLRNKSEKEEKEEKADIVENSEIPVENATVAQTEMSVVNEGTVQPLPDSSYIGSWAQVNSTPRQLDLSNVRINLPEEYNNFDEFNAARNESNIALLPINPPTARNDSYNFSGAALPINLTLMLDISGSMRLKGLAEFSKMLTLQQTLVGETGLIYTLSQLSPEVNIWVVPTPSNTDFYTADDSHPVNDPQLFGAQYFGNDPHAAMAYILSLFPAYDEFYDAAMQYGLDTLGAANPMFVQGEQNMLYFIADGIPVYGPIGSGAHGADPNIINVWQTALEEYDVDAVVIGIGGEDGMANALGPITNGEDPSSVLEPDAALSDFKDIVLSGTQQISGNLLNNDDANEDTGPSNPLVVTSFQQNGNVGMVGIPFITALGATLIVNADGSFTYEAPLSQLQNIGAVTESFDYTISNGYGSDTANFEVEIDGIDTPNVEFAYAVDDVVVLFDDVNEMQTFTGNVLDNDYLLGSESIIAATAHAFISGSGSIDGYFWPFENSVVYDNGQTRFTLNNDGSYILEELEADGLSQMVATMESINSSFKIAYALSGDNGADIGFLEFALASEAPQPIVNLENNARLQYVDIVNDDALFDNDESISSISEDVMRSSLDEAEFSSPHPENVPLDMEAPLSAFG
ncbi:hypothetical protein CC99x_005530 [Candidatus Berkiella cookevillensis]|uniref:VWFA domain-containing protein n=1 Tax=Candidatus Berkiella cookevillensis TaxID=437022 RepID=A0A0Q9YHK9_9GAMM|nr:Ig-like domain-containing protein [Candidatus Berkiella cookevillensis]MCS5708363.1 hypothetical protein [Candidatus Berkiella cookevillensis]